MVDVRDQGRPPAAGLDARDPLGTEQVGEPVAPLGGDAAHEIAVGAVADLSGDRRRQLARHAPPQRGRGVLVWQRSGRVVGVGGGTQQLVRGDART